MKTFNRLFLVLIVMIITGTAEICRGDELLGEVVKTIGKHIEIKLEGELIPQLGDEVIVGFNMPSIGFVPLQGKWSISALGSDTVTADPKGDTRQPQKDQLVKITSPNPLSRELIEQEAEILYEKGQDYFSGQKGEDKNHEKALGFYHNAAKMGSLDAMNSLGYMYGTGSGVTKNNTKAVEWFRNAAEKNHADAQRNLAIMYTGGRGVTKDNKIAFQWYLKSAKQGYAKSQRSLGIIYANGQGIAQDKKAAVKWFIKAANQGDTIAQNDLGSMYFNGSGIEQDYQKAAQWYRKAADQGYADAQYNLGVIYDQGRGVPENDAKAIIWYRKAAENGYSKAHKALIRLGQ